MTIQEDIVTALASIASGKVYPQAAPHNTAAPFVVYRKVYSDPVMTLAGYEGTTHSGFVFECWDDTYAGAISLADSVRTAIEAAAALKPSYREPADPDEFEPAVDLYVEPVQFSFWHS